MDKNYSVYLGDIDPNSKMNSPIHIRRTLMCQLLMWDSIVLSDSQLITDPRLYRLISGYDKGNEHATNEYESKDELPEYMQGLECILSSGLIEVAHRQQDGKTLLCSDVWSEMNARKDAKVPFLPESPEYAKYLDALNPSSRIYSLHEVSDFFRTELLSGLGESLILSDSDKTDSELKDMMSEQDVLFSRLLSFINNEEKAGRITAKRRNELYNYIYSCYSINIPTATGCYHTTELKYVPLHIETTTDSEEECLGLPEDKILRPTWALNPYILDLITFEDFVKIRENLKWMVENGGMVKFCSNSMSEEDIKGFDEKWDFYTRMLEAQLQNAMFRTAEMLKSSKIEELAMKPLDKMAPEKRAMVINGVQFIKSVLGAAPGVGNVLGFADVGMEAINFVTFLKNKKSKSRAYRIEDIVSEIVKDDMKIITKYKK